MTVDSLLITGRASQILSPVSGTDLVNLAAMNSALSAYMPAGGDLTAAQVVDLNATLAAWAAANGVPLSGVPLTLTLGGGLIRDSLGLRVNSGVVSVVGHTHQAGDVVDLASGVQTLVRASLAAAGSATIAVSGTSPQRFGVVTAPAGGLVVSGAGLAVDLGTAPTQAAPGDHTHAQLHDPVTLGSSSSLSGTLAGQVLSYEVQPVAGGGLLVTPSGVAVDFSVVQRAGASAGPSGVVTAVSGSPSVALTLAGGSLSAATILDPSPPSNTGGTLVAGVNGLRVALGTTATTAAVGNHGHSAATSVADGFMSASDKAAHDALWAAGVPTVGVLSGAMIISGVATTAPVNHSGVAAWFAVKVNGVAYKLPLYQ